VDPIGAGPPLPIFIRCIRAFLSAAHGLIERAAADSGRIVLDLPVIVARVQEHP
jgi:hypothetical protein